MRQRPHVRCFKTCRGPDGCRADPPSGARPPPAATKGKTTAQGSKAARYSSSIPLVGLAAPKARSDESKC